MANRNRIEALADALAADGAVDWDAEFEREADDDEERRQLAQLRVLGRIADVHRSESEVDQAAMLSTVAAVGAAPSSRQVLGERYRTSRLLGEGGMGQVWQAYDLKLCVDVALKRVHTQLVGSDKTLELLRREVRSARRVVSPHVCRIYDLEEIDGQEYISMEYIDGTTLIDVLRSRGPLRLRETMEIASQFLAGLEAIHEAGLIHRDIKPENVMMTRSGRVVLMDFGLAKPQTEDLTATIAGTPAYMAPEQIRGGRLDARTDIFAAGVVLAEMMSDGGKLDRESRARIHLGVRQDPQQLPDSRWRPVLLRAVAKDATDRHPSAGALMRALEKVTLRIEGAEQLEPYPGLASFTEGDAEYFFGRELEVEALWTKLQRPHLLALIGPSGAGKTSFLRAGLIPAMPEGWHAVACHPGDAPMAALAQALVDEFAGNTEALRGLVRFNDPEAVLETFGRWRKRHREALLIVDQFEELFTLNASEVQQQFTAVLSRLALEADVHVLLSMRDDFLFHCHGHPALAPILSELTLLGPPIGAALRRAIVQPALLCGYRFEDDSQVEEMLDEVSHERGTLPLLAFGLARLWEQRDRERGVLTRSAYREMGGVAGALAQHAEATVERVGSERLPILRELFRNLVTAQGTRAAREVQELLSVFEEREPAEQVLRELIDARLLTSFERETGEGDEARPARHVEIIHESLLSAWPRLVRWQTQDAGSAQMRDQLRQVAEVWKDRGRSDDLLWTGTAFHEFQLWRERYPGGLTATEESFGQAMAEKARRRTRRLRASVTAAFAILLVVLGAVSMLWRRSEQSREKAEAAELYALGQLELENSPTAAVAYALKSLEAADSEEVRRFVVKALWRGPTAIRFTEGEVWQTEFTSDGTRLLASYFPDGLHLWAASGGEPIKSIVVPAEPPADGEIGLALGPQADRVATYPDFDSGWVRVRSIPDLDPLREHRFAGAPRPFFDDTGDRLIVVEKTNEGYAWWSWALEVGEPTLLGRMDTPTTWDTPNGRHFCDLDPARERVAYAVDRQLHLASLDELGRTPPHLIGQHAEPIFAVAFDSTGGRIASLETAKEIRVWSPDGHLVRSLDSDGFFRMRFGSDGTVVATNTDRGFELWDLTAPPDADPLELRLSGQVQFTDVGFHPDGRWIATAHMKGGYVWPMARAYPRILRGHEKAVTFVAVAPDGSYVTSFSWDFTLRRWPLSDAAGERGEVLLSKKSGTDNVHFLAITPDARAVLAGYVEGILRVIPVDGGPVREIDLEEVDGVDPQFPPAVDRHGRYAVWVADATLRIWDADSGEVRDLGPADPGAERVNGVISMPDGLLIAAAGHVRRWDPIRGTSDLLIEGTGDLGVVRFDVSRDGRVLLACEGQARLMQCSGRAVGLDLDSGESWELTRHGNPADVALDPSGRIAITAGQDGAIRVGPVTGESPHLLLGHDGTVLSVRVTPDGRWIVSGGLDGTVRMWPMPEGRPFHTLPYDEFLARLRALTNIRVVRDPDSTTGYRLDAAPFPGWETLPTW